MPSGKFQELRRKNPKAPTPPKTLLCFDPGGTTGWAIFKEGNYFISDQFKTTFEDLENVVIRARADLILFEEYILYEHVKQDGSTLYTPRVIGVIEHLAYQHRVPITWQQASDIKQVQFNDDRLKEWGFFRTGHPHANDATRHGCRYLLRGPSKKRVPAIYQTPYYHEEYPTPPTRRRSNSPKTKTKRTLRGRK